MKNQITKETVYRIPADVKREKCCDPAGKASASEIYQYSPRGWEKLLVQRGAISADSGRIQLTVSSMMRDIELSEYVEEEEIPSLKTLRRLLNYCEYPDEKLVVGIQAIKRIGKALYGNQNAFLEIIDEESLSCMAEQYLKIREQ